jgi:hypothetical protein
VLPNPDTFQNAAAALAHLLARTPHPFMDCTYEPCEDVDPMPDYENVLTD